MSLEALAAAIRERRAILFAGGGISQNLGLPDFTALVSHIRRSMRLGDDDASVRDYAILAEAYLLHEGTIGSLRAWMLLRQLRTLLNGKSGESGPGRRPPRKHDGKPE